MQAYKAFKFRLYPTKEQSKLIDITIDCCRFLYNVMLSDRIDCYKENGTMLYTTPKMYKYFYTFLNKADSIALSYVTIFLNNAYKKFFDKQSNFPKFKSKRRSKWCYSTYNNHNLIQIKDGKIRLPKIGYIKFKQHRNIVGTIKSCTITKTRTNKYYISIMCEYENQVSPVLIDKNKSKMVGLDYSSSHFFVSSDGEIANYPKFFRKSEKKLSRALRKLSLKRNKKSRNYQKQRLLVAKIQEKIANQRFDWLHKKARDLINSYDCIFVEDLNLKSLTKGLRLGKATTDNGFGMFRSMLEHKANDCGKYFRKIDKFAPSTKLCHVCGYKNKNIKLSTRNWTCPKCNTHHDRDINAAKNILAFGKKILFNGRDDRDSSVVYSGSKPN